MAGHPLREWNFEFTRRERMAGLQTGIVCGSAAVAAAGVQSSNHDGDGARRAATRGEPSRSEEAQPLVGEPGDARK